MQSTNRSASRLRAHFVDRVISNLFSHDVDELLPVQSKLSRAPSFTEIAYENSVPWLENHTPAPFIVVCLSF